MTRGQCGLTFNVFGRGCVVLFRGDYMDASWVKELHMKPPKRNDVECVACGQVHSIMDKVKSFVCTRCGLGQTVTVIRTAGYSHKRNYPEGFWN